MGRRKIEIKAIKDDRNRSVTFLKRKGGLFKKAHELSVLCSVDVAVIIFGHNKKLYEFSSGDINETIGRYQYYGGAHEHKGPEDFMGKRDMDEEEDDDENMDEPAQGSHSPPEHAMMPHHLQSQPQFQHIRQTTPSASPPMPNGAIPYHHRHSSPQAHGISRPNSRQQIQRTGSNLVPPHHQSQPQPPQNIYAYTPNPPFYNPQAAPPMAPKPPPQHQPQYQYTHPPPAMPNPQVQQFIQEQRRQSMPPAFPQDRAQPQPQMAPMPSPPQPPPQAQQPPQQHPQQPPPPQQQQQQQAPPPPQQQSQQQQQQPSEQQFSSPPLPQPKPLPASAKNHSIFTPIDDSRSMLAQVFGGDDSRPLGQLKLEVSPRSQSIDVGAMSRSQPQINGNSPKPASQQLHKQPQRTVSTSSVPSVAVPSRSNSIMSGARPRLKVHIPSGGSDNGSGTGDSSPRDTGTTGATPAKASTDASHSSGVVLPPPSPSASALLSAGATGPPNPFARPPPPTNNGSFGNRSDMETPISALPSRFVEGNLLPSPSSFYPDWGFGRESNMLPSPLTFQTPVVTNGPGFRDEDERKRKTSDGSDGATTKRIKT